MKTRFFSYFNGRPANASTVLHATLLAAILFVPVAHAQSAAEAPVGTERPLSAARLQERYPAGTIKTTDTADQALAEVAKVRVGVDAQYADAERDCYPRFFVSACMDKAKEQRRQALAQVRQVEVEADALKRRARVEQRDKALEEKSGKADSKLLSEPILKEKSTAVVEPKPPAPPKAASPDRVAKHQAKMKRIAEKDAAKARESAENIAAHEKKVAESEARQKEIAAKRAEKEAKKEGKQK